MKLYRYKTYTQDAKLGDVIEMNEESERVKQLLKKGFIVPVAGPKEIKVIKPEEVKSKKDKPVKPEEEKAEK